jgi:uncharacterized protein (TIGR03437 family)
MRRVVRSAVFCVLATVSSLAQPNIYSLTNNYSYIPPGFPNYGIAQGSIFDVFGSGLAPLTTNLQSMPLQTMLDGVSLTVTVSGVTTRPLIYYLSSTQIAAVLPSGTPPGLGQITVTNGGATSPAAVIQVVRSAFGLVTNYDSHYPNAAVAFDANWAPLDTTNAANPGDYITLWGSGLGPVTGDEAIAPAPVDLSDIPIEVDIGGVPASVTYHGRSGSPGLDQINVIVPEGVSGCGVSVAVRTGSIVSNFATIPVAAGGRACSDPLVVNWPGSGTFLRMGSLSLSKSVTYELSSTVMTESATATFQEGEITYGAAGLSVGSCFVSRHFGNEWSVTPGPFQLPPLDAGPAINISGPLGSASLSPQQKGYYSGVIGGASGSGAVLPAFIPDAGGDFTFGNGVGGADVGPFTASFVVVPLIWTNMNAVSTVSLEDGLTVAWNNGAPSTAVTIGGTSTTMYGDQTVVGYFECLADAAAGTLTVPDMVLQSLPASTIQGYFAPLNGPASSLSISNTTGPIAFGAPGLAQGTIAVGFTITNSVQYK